MDHERKNLLAQKKAQLKIKQKRAEMQQYKDHLTKSIEHFSQKYRYLSEDDDILVFMRDEVSKDDDWRVQEILAKSFDEFCKRKGYQNALPTIDEWMKSSNPNTRRAVTEGLRIWTSRPYFKENPTLERL